MKLYSLVISLAAAVLMAVQGLAEESVVRAKGLAATYRGAVNEALVSALEQKSGVTLSTNERAQIAHNSSAQSAQQNGQLNDQRKLEINDQIQHEVQTWAKGRISGYTVVSDSFDPATQKYRVELAVRFPAKYDPPGSHPDNRRRMAVVTFRPSKPDFTWYGQAGRTIDWAEKLADQLNVRLTQTRKFTMLDRKFDAEVSAELARLSDANASPNDVSRLGQKLGTDYLIVGEVSVNNIQAPGVNPFTGQALPRASALFAEVTYRVLLAPTGQLKWTDVVRLDAASFAAADLASFLSQTAEAAASSIVDGMMANILPFEIVARTQSGQLVIGEGGKSLRVGEFFTVFALGETVKDSRTGEVLDQVEDAVGTVQIVRVAEKMSYAQVVDGDAAKMVAGSRLRRVSPAAAGIVVQPQPVTTPVKVTPTGGVVVPF